MLHLNAGFTVDFRVQCGSVNSVVVQLAATGTGEPTAKAMVMLVDVQGNLVTSPLDSTRHGQKFLDDLPRCHIVGNADYSLNGITLSRLTESRYIHPVLSPVKIPS